MVRDHLVYGRILIFLLCYLIILISWGTIMPSDPVGPYGPLIECLLSSSQTIFGRLVTVAALRNSRTGTYSHPVLAPVLDSEVANEILRREHRSRFSRWLALKLSQQRGDLCRYFDAGDSTDRSCVRHWLNYDLPALLIPAESLAPERLLFMHDIKWVLESIRHDVEPADLRFEATPPSSDLTPIDSRVRRNEKRGWLSGRFRLNRVQAT
jgi:hypothetical protein